MGDAVDGSLLHSMSFPSLRIVVSARGIPNLRCGGIRIDPRFLDLAKPEVYRPPLYSRLISATSNVLFSASADRCLR
jgi:hypothetical protein